MLKIKCVATCNSMRNYGYEYFKDVDYFFPTERGFIILVHAIEGISKTDKKCADYWVVAPAAIGAKGKSFDTAHEAMDYIYALLGI